MSRRLSYTTEALDDLDAMEGWQMQPDSGPAAGRRIKAIRAAIDGLRVHPCRRPVVNQAGVRELPCPGGCRASDRVLPDTGKNASAGDVQVPRVHGPGQSRHIDQTLRRRAAEEPPHDADARIDASGRPRVSGSSRAARITSPYAQAASAPIAAPRPSLADSAPTSVGKNAAMPRPKL